MAELPPDRPGYVTASGGLWTELTHADSLLTGKQALGWLDDTEADRLRAWLRDGYVILRQAVSTELIDRVLKDIDTVVQSELPQSRVSYWKDGEKYFQQASAERMREEEAKLLDMHMLSEAVREAIFSPALLRFITLLFERPPVAFQSLTFTLGSQQPIHCDVAFVHVSSPREFVASWIALEDVTEGAGELEYFPGSHRLSDHLFGDSPWADGDLSRYSQALVDKAESAGLKRQRFLPRKGDVLIWNAGLYHGGAPRTRADATRRSLVTHYCPRGRHPMYADAAFERCQPTPHGGYVAGNFPSTVQRV